MSKTRKVLADAAATPAEQPQQVIDLTMLRVTIARDVMMESIRESFRQKIEKGVHLRWVAEFAVDAADELIKALSKGGATDGSQPA